MDAIKSISSVLSSMSGNNYVRKHSSAVTVKAESPEPAANAPVINENIGKTLVNTVETVAAKSREFAIQQEEQPGFNEKLEKLDMNLMAPADMEQFLDDLRMDYNINFSLSTDKDTGKYVVQILSADGSRVLRQMPPSSVLTFIRRQVKGEEGLVTTVV